MPADMAGDARAQAIRLLEARNPAGAAALLRQAIALRPGDAELHNTLGIALLTQGDKAGGRASLERAVELDRRHVAALTNLGLVFEMEHNTERAVSAYKRVLEIDPASPVREKLAAIYRVSVPAWHFTMMNDVQRNEVYDAAIRRLAPGRGVLDIGTGAGLLAMMSARAGASWVTSCEVNQPIAAIAREVVAKNGLADRIKLVAKHSTALSVGADLPARADLLVCEIIGSNVINEEMLPTIEHAHAHLLKPDAAIVPRRVVVMGSLVGGPQVEGYFHVDRAAGFDLTPFNEYARPSLPFRLGNIPHENLSADFEIFAFDLTRPPFPPQQRTIEVTATKPGRCVGIAQWTRIDVADGLVYENRPDPGTPIDSWGQLVYRFAAPVEVTAGERLRIAAEHDRAELKLARV